MAKLKKSSSITDPKPPRSLADSIILNPKTVTPQKATVRKEYRDNIVTSEYSSIVKLLPYLEGQSWTVNYYRQLLGPDQTPEAFSPTSTTQQLEEILRLEIKVQTPLTVTQGENNTTAVEGTGIIYSGLIPNKGDVFVADVGDGRAALLTITSTVRAEIMLESCYEVNYQVISYVDQALQATLDGKVVNTFTFKKDRMVDNKSAMIAVGDHEKIEKLQQGIGRVVQHFTRVSWNDEAFTYFVPGTTIYDRHVTRFMNELMMNRHKMYKPGTELMFPGDMRPNITIYDMILERATDLRDVGYSFTVESVGSIPREPFVTGGIVFSRATDYVAVSTSTVLAMPIENIDTDNLPTIVDVHLGSSYVHSLNFYNESLPCASKLEVQVRALINGNALCVDTLLEILDNVRMWKPEQVFYYGPILIALLYIADKEL